MSAAPPGQIGGCGVAPATVAIEPSLEPARSRFCGQIVGRILAFEAFRAAIVAQSDPRQGWHEIAGLAHMIAGTAETVGFPRAGQLAGALELATRQALAGQTPLAAQWPTIEPQLDDLLDALEQLLDA